MSHSGGRVEVGRVALVELAAEGDLLRVDMDERHAPQSAAVVDHVDRAPVGELRHDEPGDALERLLVVE